MPARTKDNYTIVSEKELPNSLKEFAVEISVETFETYRKEILKNTVAETELPGFRKGKAPEKNVIATIGEMALLERAAEKAINIITFSIISEKKLRFVGQPSIAITTLAPGNPLRFTLTVSVVPEITTPDYKEIAATINRKKIEPTEITESEFKESLTRIEKILSQEKKAAGEIKSFELNDEEAKKLGGFANLEEFKTKLKKDLLEDKKNRAKEKRTLEIVEALVSKMTVSLPAALIEEEIDQIESEFAHEMSRMGVSLEEYAKRVNKTKEELREGWRDNAEKRAKFELLFPRIAKAENLTVPHDEVERETKHLLEHNPEAKKETAALYVERVLLRQKVLSFLAEQK
ncbi:MAG TPA: trigger factor [Candidatus Paceibacterota bacterium]